MVTTNYHAPQNKNQVNKDQANKTFYRPGLLNITIQMSPELRFGLSGNASQRETKTFLIGCSMWSKMHDGI